MRGVGGTETEPMARTRPYLDSNDQLSPATVTAMEKEVDGMFYLRTKPLQVVTLISLGEPKTQLESAPVRAIQVSWGRGLAGYAWTSRWAS